MKIKIRKSTFETNSSSIHSLCIPRNAFYKVPKYVNFYLGHYGWGPDVEMNPGNYLYTYLALTNDDKRIKQLKNILYKHGAEHVSFEPYNKKEEWYDFYIDHASESENWVNSLFADEDKLLRHLFTPGAVIYMTNDNSPDRKIMRKINAAKECDDEVVSLG